MIINREWLHRTVRSTVLSAGMLSLGIFGLAAQRAEAQTYSCFPNCEESDGRALILAGAGSNTLAGDTIVMKITSPATATTVEVGIFDGESGGRFDNGNVPLEYILYADPSGEGKNFSTQIASWSGADMTNDAWTSYTVTNAASAKAPSGSYIYSLRIRNTNPSVTGSYSGFKLRTDGAIALKGYQSFAVFVPLANAYDRAAIYPTGTSNPTNTTYDGTWKFYLDVPFAMTTFAVWDGDMDHGNMSASVLDTDDEDTPNTPPSWATGTAAVEEGVAIGDRISVDPVRYSTGSPSDDGTFAIFTRSPSVWYEIVHPNGRRDSNMNPSGNLEWEQFVLSTAPYDRSTMDRHVDSLPAGLYTVEMHGMDLHNLNAWRFFNDALGTNSNVEIVGVNDSGRAVVPAKPYNVTGTIYFDVNGNGAQDAGENGIPAVTVRLNCDYNVDGVTDETKVTTTDSNGYYIFPNVGAGQHVVKVDMATLSEDVTATGDADGTTTLTADGVTSTTTASFAYQRVVATTARVGTGTRGYWVNHEENWPVNGLSLGGTWYSKDQCLAILRRPTKGDRSYSMAAQLIAAKLNVANGALHDCIDETISSADTWMSTYKINSKPNNNAWNLGVDYHDTLDDYNNGRMCAPHMD